MIQIPLDNGLIGIVFQSTGRQLLLCPEEYYELFPEQIPEDIEENENG